VRPAELTRCCSKPGYTSPQATGRRKSGGGAACSVNSIGPG